jgi:hypothetical protein
MGFIDSQTIHGLGGTPVSTDVLDQSNYKVYEKECAGCRRIQPFGCFRRDSSYREGVRDLCLDCETSPKLSTEEHLENQREKNYRAASKQRWSNQEDYENEEARWGYVMDSSEVLRKIFKLIPHDLFITDGRIIGDLALYRVYGSPQPDLDGRTFRYLFYIPQSRLPEFSQYEFDHRDVPIREKRRGWRTVLLRLIKTGLVTEEQVEEEFGPALGEASTVWRRTLWQHRNGKTR